MKITLLVALIVGLIANLINLNIMFALNDGGFVAFVAAAILYLLTFFNLISVIVLWKNYKIKSFLPLIVTILFVLLLSKSSETGHWLRYQKFNRNLQKYIEVYEIVKSGKIKESHPLGIIEIPKISKYLDGIMIIERDKNGNLNETIVSIGGGFPFYYSRYMFKDNGKNISLVRQHDDWCKRR